MKLILVSAVVGLALAGGQTALAAHGAQHSAPSTLTVVMHDPGCHWFSIHGKLATKASVNGPLRLRNLDEATLKVASRSTMRYVKVGRTIVLPRGNYVVMMVGQAVDDNYLKLTVR